MAIYDPIIHQILLKPTNSTLICTMGSPRFFIFLLVLTFLALLATTQNDPSGCSNATERNTLLVLRDQFNNSFLNGNWISLQSHSPQWHGVRCANGRVAGIVLENMGLVGKLEPDALAALAELSVLSLKNNSISGNLMDLSHNQKLTRIDLSGNMFDGLISDSLKNLNSLETLQLQDNRLTGSIPDFTQPSLRNFNVSNNRLSGPIPNAKVLQSFSFSSFLGNGKLCGPPSFAACKIVHNETSIPQSDNTNNGDSSSSKSPYGPVFLALGIVGFIFLSFLFVIYYQKSRRLKRKMKKRSFVVKEVEKIDEKKEVEARERCDKGGLIFMGEEGGFELNDLLKAAAQGLGRGNFGNCYKAVLNDGSAMVVKRLRDLKPLSQDEFMKQLQAIADLKHPNLLPLTAFCYSEDEKLLVYKFASHGNVYSRIHGGRGPKERVPFRWNERLSVARGAARALEYLHRSPINPQAINVVPHGNLKSTNVLLDENDTVLLSDYGLATLISLPLVAQRMVAYKSPEYLSHKKVSKKSDVWSYGCLLLELLTGRVSALAAPQGISNGIDLGSWVHRAVREEWTAEIFDSEILAQSSANHSMLRLLQIAIRCCNKWPEKRPEMSEVAREVDNIKLAVDSEDEEDGSVDQSFTDDSVVSASSPKVI